MSKNFKQDATSGDVQLGRRGPRIIVSGSSIRFRNSSNAAYTTGEVADPVSNDQIANKRYVDQKVGGTGTAILDFGPFPGSSDTITLVFDSNIQATSIVDAWILPAATSDHSFDEHVVDAPRVVAGGVGAGIGFTIYGVANSIPLLNSISGIKRDEVPRVYGQWNVGWRWR